MHRWNCLPSFALALTAASAAAMPVRAPVTSTQGPARPRPADAPENAPYRPLSVPVPENAPFGLQLISALAAGTLAVGYALVPMARAGNSLSPTVMLPVAFGFGAGLGVWLGGHWGGRPASFAATVLTAMLPGIVAAGLVAVSFRYGPGLAVGLLVAPILSMVGAFLGFELSRPRETAVGLHTPRRALADERGT